MIVSEKKTIEEIISFCGNHDKIFIIGCAQCATSCSAGGEKEVNALAEELKKRGFEITGTIILDPPCDERISRVELKKKADELNKSTALIVMACGAGITVISEMTEGKNIIAGISGVFLGSQKRLGIYNEFCSLCGECVLSVTNGVCPVTRCPKSLLNGPCGGVVNGKYCEVNPENRCAWSLIIEKSAGSEVKKKRIEQYRNPKDNSKHGKPNSFNKR